MINFPGMVIIGAAGRNMGKTEFACRLIEREKGAGKAVYGVKITTVQDKGLCPRGGSGCGVCDSLDSRFRISREKQHGDQTKDTARMLAAGADHVLWLLVQEESLKEGVEKLLYEIPEKAVVVCESNSARRVVEPGLFIVIRERGSTRVKPSCEAVLSLAHKVVEFSGNSFSLPTDVFCHLDGRWIISHSADERGIEC